jgi:transcriptional regulator with AAA-type ATPase domain
MAEVVGRARSVQAILDLIAERADGTGRPVVLIDGGSGAGKSVLADDLVTPDGRPAPRPPRRRLSRVVRAGGRLRGGH